MTYFTPEFCNFFAELREHNDREWFNANKPRYEQYVKQPMENFVAAVLDRMQVHEPLMGVKPKDCIFRIYRDTRFSSDKTPYKEFTSAVVGKGGRQDVNNIGIYMELNDQKVAFYGGVYMPDTKQLYRIREAIAYDLAGFAALIQESAFQEKFAGEIHGEVNKRLPKAFMAAAEQQPLLYKKQFYFLRELAPELLFQPNLVDEVIAYYLAARPLSQFLVQAIQEVE
jgi:uncharacterized protein (TIGR02453 family)